MSKVTWIVEGPWRDVPGTDERECDRVELSGYEISTAFEAYRLACLPGNPAFGEVRCWKAGPDDVPSTWVVEWFASSLSSPSISIPHDLGARGHFEVVETVEALTAFEAWHLVRESGDVPPFEECTVLKAEGSR